MRLCIKKVIILLYLVFQSTASLQGWELSSFKILWNSWKTIHNKMYKMGDEFYRFQIFMENYKIVQEHNRNNNNTKLAINKFGDLTDQEFKNLHFEGYTNHQHSDESENYREDADFEAFNLPIRIDWREKGAVTPVKNQLYCGSCWAFSAVGALESLYFLTHGKLLSFSEQQLVDCDTGSYGCNGGYYETAFEHTAHHGIQLEETYPYTAKNGQCLLDESISLKINTGLRILPRKNSKSLKAALSIQPVSIAIQADSKEFQFYKSGVIKDGCGDQLNHAVLAVGFDTSNEGDYYIIKNSWGVEWGFNGYVHISTDEKSNSGNGVCGILGDPVIPTL